MANWMDQVDIIAVWQKSKDKDVSLLNFEDIKEVSDAIVKELKTINPLNEEDKTDIAELVDNFSLLSENCAENTDVFESDEDAVINFNLFMNDLYNWGDILINSEKNQKRCWIATNF
jgi:hypothetical protein